jgi:hypothetical protein
MSGLTILVPPGQSFTITGTPAPTLRWHVGPVRRKEVAVPIEVSLSNEEKVRLTVTPMTPGGQPATIDGPAQWSVTGTCTLEAIDDVSTWVVSGADIGDSVVTVQADADLGAGIVHIADTATVHVENPMASSLGLAAGEPELKNPPA